MRARSTTSVYRGASRAIGRPAWPPPVRVSGASAGRGIAFRQQQSLQPAERAQQRLPRRRAARSRSVGRRLHLLQRQQESSATGGSRRNPGRRAASAPGRRQRGTPTSPRAAAAPPVAAGAQRPHAHRSAVIHPAPSSRHVLPPGTSCRASPAPRQQIRPPRGLARRLRSAALPCLHTVTPNPYRALYRARLSPPAPRACFSCSAPPWPRRQRRCASRTSPMWKACASNQLIGYGLVVGLNGTGDKLNNNIFTLESLVGMLERLGVNTRDQIANLTTKDVAAVMVTAELPRLLPRRQPDRRHRLRPRRRHQPDRRHPAGHAPARGRRRGLRGRSGRARHRRDRRARRCVLGHARRADRGTHRQWRLSGTGGRVSARQGQVAPAGPAQSGSDHRPAHRRGHQRRARHRSAAPPTRAPWRSISAAGTRSTRWRRSRTCAWSRTAPPSWSSRKPAAPSSWAPMCGSARWRSPRAT